MSVPPPALSTTFRSVYRLFLRACSTAVLHQPRATGRLRRLWRPVFDGAAVMIRRHERETDAASKARIEKWMSTWNSRVDETLELLYTSSKSRGLPHEVTKNLVKLYVSQERNQWRIEASYPVWNPKLDPIKQAKTLEKAREKLLESQASVKKGMDALSEVIALAEARDGLSLGRVIVRRKVKKL
ncbi:hypothetical protein DFP72DRAFT_32739 [Ephemerocybe angulata]|uniref:Uncharacterized protein n=1 Tax=Ephemerocybe angulata TaxID=980116 RepID=A0A8H6I945_9AGAR|nr:hypothetical protein DFP72DRAFT_32739 [Tulosesus angulatus]